MSAPFLSLTREQADAIRLSLAQAQAREAKLREAAKWALGEDDSDFRPREAGEGAYWWRTEFRKRCGDALLATPADDGALREMLEAAVNDAWSVYGTDEDTSTLLAGIVARVLGGAS